MKILIYIIVVLIILPQLSVVLVTQSVRIQKIIIYTAFHIINFLEIVMQK